MRAKVLYNESGHVTEKDNTLFLDVTLVAVEIYPAPCHTIYKTAYRVCDSGDRRDIVYSEAIPLYDLSAPQAIREAIKAFDVLLYNMDREYAYHDND